ncbi:hypothetical protein I7I50_05344 [Histoplasma capsulatum G186AR]|uniref:Secreted protein n=1 Tax=Ajellomyces capsulatus TaxID=5037 RepID=A0A8H7Z6M1_AJECA|nr:hypothetical protein I7I52_03605 [Histoplasma capsulatum]QSS76024.1 hypothetical protein I7I50_05344 [Histoplasma capsulatum G186AR]
MLRGCAGFLTLAVVQVILSWKSFFRQECDIFNHHQKPSPRNSVCELASAKHTFSCPWPGDHC